MFNKTLHGTYVWFIRDENLYIIYSDEEFLPNTKPTTAIVVDRMEFQLNGDFRKEFKRTKGDVAKIGKLFIKNITKCEMYQPDKEDTLVQIFRRYMMKYLLK